MFLSLVFLSVHATAGTLSLGRPTIESNRYVFPVMYRGEADEVAALDFRFSYDPAVFEPAGAETGVAALAAGKQVTSNVIEPGQVVVLMMGANRNTLGEGPVAYIAMRQVAEPEDGVTRLTVSDTTFATAEGVEIPSRGSTRAVRMGEDEASGSPAPEPGEDQAPPDNGPDVEGVGGVDAGTASGTARGGGLIPEMDGSEPGSMTPRSVQQTAEASTGSTADGIAGRTIRAEDGAPINGEIQPLGRSGDFAEEAEALPQVTVAAGSGGDTVPGTHTGIEIGRIAGDRDIAATTPEPEASASGLGRWMALAAIGVLVVLAMGWARRRLFP